MNAARLLAWERLARARRGERGWLLALGAGAVGAAGLYALERAHGAAEARAWWVIGACFALAGVVMRAPFRLYWREDATLLARLPIPGEALYRLALQRSVRAGVQVGLLVALAAAPRALADGAEVAARLAGFALGAGLVAGVLAAPVGALAGVLVASDKATRGLNSVAGEGGAPPVIWLSLIPALGGLAVAVAAWACAPAVVRGVADATTWGIAAAAVIAPPVALAACAPLAAYWLSGATREIAALDAVKLAHVELDRARGLEAVWGRAVAGGGAAGAVYRKDVALARRRHPMYYLLTGLGLLVLWGIAVFAGEATRTAWTVGVSAGMAGYLAVMGFRLARPDIERPRLLAVLPMARGVVARGKLGLLGWRAVMIGVAAGPAIARAPLLGVTVAALALGALVVGGVAATARR